MTQATLTPYPGVIRRPDSAKYQFVLQVPQDLRGQFASPWAVRKSLGTADLRAANDLAKALQAEWAARFAALRSGRPAEIDVVELRKRMLARLEANMAHLDQLAATWSRDRREESLSMYRWQHAEAQDGLKHGYFPEWAADHIEAKYRGSAVVEGEALPFIELRMRLSVEALEDLTRTFPIRVAEVRAKRALLALSEGPQATAAPVPLPSTAQTPAYRIADALHAWLLEDDSRAAKTQGVFKRHADTFAQMMGDPALANVTKIDAMRFRDQLTEWAKEKGKTARTADNVLVSVRALVNVARDKGWMEGNPFERLSVKQGGKKSAKREPWTGEELATLFHDPIWLSYSLPDDRKAGGAAAYWIPLIACYAGARLSEIAQLWTSDLQLSKGQEVIEFCRSDERQQRLKNEGSWRAVPMHGELIRLGLCDYAASLAEGPLFPDLPRSGRNGAGGQFGQWFGTYKTGKGFVGITKSMHSFRHLVASELLMSGASPALADAITGHAGDSVARKVYAATIRREAERLRSTINKLHYAHIADLPRVALPMG